MMDENKWTREIGKERRKISELQKEFTDIEGKIKENKRKGGRKRSRERKESNRGENRTMELY